MDNKKEFKNMKNSFTKLILEGLKINMFLSKNKVNQKIKVVNKIRNYKMNKNKWIDNKSNKLQRH
jgi:hypothetical protein